MKALVLNGSRKHDTLSRDVFNTVLNELTTSSCDVASYDLFTTKIAYCMGCYECWISSPGTCTINDAASEIAGKAIHSDLLIFVSPVMFGSYSSELKRVIERLLPIFSPFFHRVNGMIHYKPRYTRYPHLIGLGTMSRRDEVNTLTFKSLVSRNAITLHSPTHAAEIITENTNLGEVRRIVRSFLIKKGVGVYL